MRFSSSCSFVMNPNSFINSGYSKFICVSNSALRKAAPSSNISHVHPWSSIYNNTDNSIAIVDGLATGENDLVQSTPGA